MKNLLLSLFLFLGSFAHGQDIWKGAESGDTKALQGLSPRDVNQTNEYGSTLLIAASSRGRAAVVRLLLQKGADKGGLWTALHCASQNGHEEVARLLLTQPRRRIG